MSDGTPKATPLGALASGGMPILTQQDLAIAEIRAHAQQTAADVESLCRIIRDGNGEKPLTVRVALLERKVDDFALTMQEVRKALEGRVLEETKGKWGLVAAIIAGLIMIANTIVGALLVTRVKGP